jgi:glycosyltransferase involved in cell wall biosynthesis
VTPPRRIRVVTMIDRLAPSGAEIFASRVAEELDPSRFERILCVTRPSPAELVAPLEDAGVRVLQLGRRSKLDVWRWWPLVSLLRRERVDVLHSHKFGSNAWGALLARAAGVPVFVAHEHTWSYEGQWLRRFLDRRLVSRIAAVVLTVSEADRLRMIEIERVDPRKVAYLPSGVRPHVPTGRRRVREELGLAAEAPIVGTVCGLRPQKALDVLVRASARLVVAVPGVRVLILGEGPERRRLEALIDELVLGETVSLLGAWPAEEVADFVDALDVAVLSSQFEGMPLAAMEFMSAGKPVVATAVGGLPDLIGDGVHGLLVPPGDPEELAEALASLLHDPERRASMGRAGLERQRREFDFAGMVRKLEGRYEELVAGKISP